MAMEMVAATYVTKEKALQFFEKQGLLAEECQEQARDTGKLCRP
jgi:hypothetical protein